MAEFSLIERFCKGIGAEHASTTLSVGDDAAVISIPESMELAISVDTMVAGVHFYPDAKPEYIAHKLLAVNLSDMAAMGAEPKWATMTLTAPSVDNQWLEAFSGSLNHMATKHSVQLIGGDTTQGQLNLSIQIMGLLPKSKALKRSSAKTGDDVYVSNTIGDAALALRCLDAKKNNKVDDTIEGLLSPSLCQSLEQPEPQVQLGLELLGLANSCIDISDGLIADLSHIANQSNVSIDVDVNLLPLSLSYKTFMEQGGNEDLALTGGDDYQLAFSVPKKRSDEIQALSKQLNIPITRVGQVAERNNDSVNLKRGDSLYKLTNNAGYQHFQTS